MIGFGQSYVPDDNLEEAIVSFISVESIEEKMPEDWDEDEVLWFPGEIFKFTFKEYNCNPECTSIGLLVLYSETYYYEENSFPFFRPELDLSSKIDSEYLFEIKYINNKLKAIKL
jgi:hypothetical protein